MGRRFFRSFEVAVNSWIKVDRPLPLQLDITNACNLACSHCYHSHHKNQGALATSDWLKVIEQYKEVLHSTGFKPYFIFCGGEPLLNTNLFPMLDVVSAMFPNAPMRILTNGTLISSKIADSLTKFKNVGLQISLDGSCAETHDVTRGLGSFKRTENGVLRLRERNIPFSTLTVLSKKSSGEIPSFFVLGKSWGAHTVAFTRLIDTGSAQNMKLSGLDRPLTPFELREAYRKILVESAKSMVPSSVHEPLFHLIHPALGKNGRFFEGIVVDYQGFILASSRSRIRLGHVFKEGMRKVLFENELLRAITAGNIEGCGKCPDFIICGGDRNAAYASSGNYLGKDPGCWRPTQPNNGRNL